MPPKKKQPNQQSEPITPKEILANEPEVKEVLDVNVEKALDDLVELAAKHAPISAEQSAAEILEKASIQINMDALPTLTPEKLIEQFHQTGILIGRADVPQTEEEKILSFLQGKEGYVRLNEFLKSLYGVPKFNHPVPFLQQGESKSLKATLQKLVDEGKIDVKGSAHQLLGRFYYDGDDKQRHRNLNDVVIEAATKNS